MQCHTVIIQLNRTFHSWVIARVIELKLRSFWSNAVYLSKNQDMNLWVVFVQVFRKFRCINQSRKSTPLLAPFVPPKSTEVFHRCLEKRFEPNGRVFGCRIWLVWASVQPDSTRISSMCSLRHSYSISAFVLKRAAQLAEMYELVQYYYHLGAAEISPPIISLTLNNTDIYLVHIVKIAPF